MCQHWPIPSIGVASGTLGPYESYIFSESIDINDSVEYVDSFVLIQLHTVLLKAQLSPVRKVVQCKALRSFVIE